MSLTSLETHKNGLGLCNNMFTMTVDNKLVEKQGFQKGLIYYEWCQNRGKVHLFLI